MPLDPEVAAFLETYNNAPPLPLWSLSSDEGRAGVAPIPGPPEEIGAVADVECPVPRGPIAIRLYEPRQATTSGVTLFYHGGGWFTGSLDTHDALARRLCNESRSRLAAVDYRLAPEHPFPAAIEDAFAAVTWAARQFSSAGAPVPLAVCGDSAGGNLAAAVCLMSRDRGGPAISAQTLLYPITNNAFDTPSYRAHAKGFLLTRRTMRWFWQQYLAAPEDADHPCASILRASDLSRLPPALVVTCEYDVLRDEGVAYADRLESAGVDVARLQCDGMIHGFLRRLNVFSRATEVCREIGTFLQQRLQSQGLC